MASCKTKINSPVAFSHTNIEVYTLCYVVIISEINIPTVYQHSEATASRQMVCEGDGKNKRALLGGMFGGPGAMEKNLWLDSISQISVGRSHRFCASTSNWEKSADTHSNEG
jgi:hypothetical protein